MDKEAASPSPLSEVHFNPDPTLPYGLEVEHVADSMRDFLTFIKTINLALFEKGLPRLESIAMPANFSTLVSEFMHRQIPQHCPDLAQNQYHNGHPDLLPSGTYEGDSVHQADEGIEVKASRYRDRWQGHNVEECWLMGFQYDSNSPNDPDPIRCFEFKGAFIAQLEEGDWSFSGRSEESRRTITASVLASGRDRMLENYIYDVERPPQGNLFQSEN